MRTSRWPTRLFATASTSGALTTALTVMSIPASHAEITTPHRVVEISDGLSWH